MKPQKRKWEQSVDYSCVHAFHAAGFDSPDSFKSAKVSDLLLVPEVDANNVASLLAFFYGENNKWRKQIDHMAMYEEQGSLSEKLKPIERRIKTLDEHLRHSENYKSGYHHKVQYEKLYAQYEAIKKAGGFRADSKAQKALDAANAYYRDHDSEIVLFEAAERYLKDVLQKRFDPKKLPPIAKWKAERDRLIGEKKQLSEKYRTLKDEVKEVERIKKSIDNILREEYRREQPSLKQDLER